jgi:hypothetical protein
LTQSSVSKNKISKKQAKHIKRERETLRQNKSSFMTDQSVDSPWNRTPSEVNDEVLFLSLWVSSLKTGRVCPLSKVMVNIQYIFIIFTVSHVYIIHDLSLVKILIHSVTHIYIIFTILHA